jgi:predicted MFS family arabinose efflux permease
MTAPASLWRHPAFMKLWAAQTVSSFGARIAREGLPMTAVLVLRAPPAAMGALAAVGLAAYALVGMAAGALADRAPRRALMIGADLGRTLVMIAVPAAALAHALSIAGVAVALALMSGLTVIFDVADHAFLPGVVDQTQLVDGNARLAATDAAAEIGGPAVAGLLFQLLSAPVAAGASALTYLASALFLARLPPQPSGAQAAASATLAPFSGFRIVLAHPVVRPIWLMAVIGDFFGWFFGALYILYALAVLRLSTTELGLTIAAGGAGALVGAAAAPVFSRRLGAGPAIVTAGFAMALATFLIPLAGGPPLAAMALLVAAQLAGDALRTVMQIAQTSLRQTVLPTGELGRVAGAFATGQGLAGVAGALIGGALGALLGPREALLLAAAGLTVTPLIGLASPLWRARGAAGRETLLQDESVR